MQVQKAFECDWCRVLTTFTTVSGGLISRGCFIRPHPTRVQDKFGRRLCILYLGTVLRLFGAGVVFQR